MTVMRTAAAFWLAAAICCSAIALIGDSLLEEPVFKEPQAAIFGSLMLTGFWAWSYGALLSPFAKWNLNEGPAIWMSASLAVLSSLLLACGYLLEWFLLIPAAVLAPYPIGVLLTIRAEVKVRGSVKNRMERQI